MKNRMNNLKKTLILLFAVTFSIPFFCRSITFGDDIKEYEAVQVTKDQSTRVPGKMPVLNAGAAIVMDTVTGRVLFEKNAYSKRAMASTTKIMTALLAIEKGNLNDTVTVSKRAAAVGGSKMGLYAGEKITLRDLMYGLMIESGNDAAIAIAEHIGGSVDGFSAMMNEKAKELGAVNTSFRCPHGLDMEGHYTTAYDLALIARYALKNDTFNRYVATRSATVGKRSMNNTNEMLSLYPGADGVKTGYTGKAGRCLVTSATRSNWRVISVVLGCSSRTTRANDSKKILDYAFENYKFQKLLPNKEQLDKIFVDRGIEEYAEAEGSEEIVLPMRDDEFARIEQRAELPERLEAPVQAGTEVGSLEYLLDGKSLGEIKLYISRDVKRKDYEYYLKQILQKWLDLSKGKIENIWFPGSEPEGS